MFWSVLTPQSNAFTFTFKVFIVSQFRGIKQKKMDGSPEAVYKVGVGVTDLGEVSVASKQSKKRKRKAWTQVNLNYMGPLTSC